ncbi:MAG: MobA-like protein [Segetibacter sp.]|jgi:molybdenum cofactor cytidylyltransferase|nr:MobA-like protein [Segetibacter sp.]
MTGLVLLAAGASTRLGQPKQQLQFKGKTLLQQAIDTAIHSGCSPVIVVLGANAGPIEDELENLRVRIIHNSQWQEGMASSIRLGIDELQKAEPAISYVIVMVCDQPFVDSLLLQQLIEAKKSTGKKIVASFYNNTAGVPVLFDKSLFPELLLLKGQDGAKKLLVKHSEEVALIPFPLGNIDIDTADDYKALASL